MGQRLLDERIPRHEVRAGIEAVFSLKEALKKFLEPFSTQNKIVTKEVSLNFC